MDSGLSGIPVGDGVALNTHMIQILKVKFHICQYRFQGMKKSRFQLMGIKGVDRKITVYQGHGFNLRILQGVLSQPHAQQTQCTLPEAIMTRPIQIRRRVLLRIFIGPEFILMAYSFIERKDCNE